MEFDPIESKIQSGDISGSLSLLCENLKKQKRYPEWFEALKMKARHDLGLEIWAQANDQDLPLDISRKLEDELVEACRVVGEAMIQDGLIREGWMYLRPVGDPVRARELLLQQPINDETLDAIIEVAIGHGVHPAWGYQLMLDRMGTCNAITTFDNQMQSATLSQRQQAASALISQLYEELVSGIHHALNLPVEESPVEFPLEPLLAAHSDLCEEGRYHIDPSHLSSVVRIGRIVDDSAAQRKAMQLCLYGTKLDPSLHPEAHSPFDPYFESHRKYYHVLLGEDTTQQSLAYFRKQRFQTTAEVDKPNYNFGLEDQFEATETLVELLVRTGQFQEATTVLLDQLERSAEHQTSRWSAALFDCCRRSGDYSALNQYGKENGDAIGFTLACVYQKERETSKGSS